ncbi:hypothetical protein [Laspinema olomoucense]|uniref:hypothetical protein n=1 Tax=Laspinema olomoucense TaxID=3231600 RepID=UPI0021BB15FE|nr:hypothetical protein [Laspinema sp. D3d]MCT7975255.1 hypothetical protein [Laspinema sp. D3d]
MDIETLDILQQCDCSKATFYRAMGKFQEIALFDFQAKLSFRNQKGFSKSVSNLQTQSQDCETSRKNENLSLKNETDVAGMRKSKPQARSGQGVQNLSDYLDIQTKKPPIKKVAGEQIDSEMLKAIDCPPVQTDCPIVQADCPNGQVSGPIVQVSGPIVPNERPKPNHRKRFETLSDNSNRSNKPTTQKKVAGEQIFRKPEEDAPQEKSPNIPRDLYAKLQELQILTGNPGKDASVLRAIAAKDISQAYGAAAHVERSFETCSNPKSVFLFQLPKQPKEKLGPIQPVKTAEDFRLPIAILKKTYPGTWREAAAYHGYSPEEINAHE